MEKKNKAGRFKALLLAAMVAVGIVTQVRPAAAQGAPDYGALRRTPGTNCNNNAMPVGPTPSCVDWVNLSGCLTHVASQPGNAGTCTQVSTAALQAIEGARAACAAADADQARRIAELTQRLARCERPAAPRSNLVRIPICLADTGAATQITLRNGTVCRVQMDPRRHVVQVLAGRPDLCARIDRRDVVRAGCYCPPGFSDFRVASGRGVACLMTVGTGTAQVVLRPPLMNDGALEARVTALEGQVSTLATQLETLCAHDVVNSDGTGARSTDCAEMNRLLMERLFAASATAAPLDTSGITDRLARLEENDRRQDRDIASLRVDVDALRHSATAIDRLDAHFFATVEGGSGVLPGMTPVYGVAGARLRVRVSHLFSVHAAGGALYGLYGAPMFPTATGYLADVGFGFSFGEGSTRHTIDLAFGVRTYTNTGYSEIQSIDRGVILGDYRGRVFGVRASYEFAWKSLAIQPSLFVGYGDSALGVIATRGNQRVALFGSDVGVTVMGGLTFLIGTPPRF